MSISVSRSLRVLFSVAAVLLLASCPGGWQGEECDFRQDMRDFVGGIGSYARESAADFIVIPQNGHELVTEDGEPTGDPAAAYLGVIDGVGREDLFYGYESDDEPTPQAERDRMIGFLDVAEDNGVEALVTDYCVTPANVDDSYALNEARGYVSFAAPSRELDTIPDDPSAPFGASTDDVTDLGGAANFLYLLNPAQYPTKGAYLAAIAATDYDLVIMDLFYEDAEGTAVELEAADLEPLRTKASGGTRLLICYMSIGEAEDYRFYWDPAWDTSPPSWLAEENPSWPGNYKVEYWDPAWQAVIFGSADAYLDKILASGFDGVYLDIIDAYEYFEAALGM